MLYEAPAALSFAFPPVHPRPSRISAGNLTLNKIRKLFSNIGVNAFRRLGLSNYIKMLFFLLWNTKKIVESGKIYWLDDAMNKLSQPLKIRYNNNAYFFDLAYIDRQLDEKIYFTFGNIREIFISDCYLKYQPREAFYQSKTVVDLGANRGIFSTLMTPVAEKIICVEVQSRYIDIIKYNMELNNFKNYAIECCFIGDDGLCSDLIKKDNKITLDDIMKKYDLHHMDFIKMDIEGSEFALFKSAAWLQNVNHISMEVHHDYGNINTILTALKDYGFSYVLVDENFQPISDATQTVHLYASRITSKSDS